MTDDILNATLTRALNRLGIWRCRTPKTEQNYRHALWFQASGEYLGDYDAKEAWELVRKMTP
jgi:hypothetical protein